MAGDKRIEFDNFAALTAAEAIPFIRKLFTQYLPSFKVSREYGVPSGYWIVVYVKNEIEISIESSRAYLEWILTIDNQIVNLKAIDPETKNILLASKFNVEYMVQLTKRVLHDRQ